LGYPISEGEDLPIQPRTKTIVPEILLWLFASFIALTLRFEYVPNVEILTRGFFVALIMRLGLSVISAADKKLFGSFQELSSDQLASVFRTFVILSVLSSLPLLFLKQIALPRSFAILTAGIAMFLQTAVSFFVRDISRRKKSIESAKSVIIFGAGSYSQILIRMMVDQIQKEWHIIGMIDDDPNKMNVKFLGIKVIGNTNSLEGLIKSHKATDLIIAVAKLETKKLEQLEDIARRYQIKISIVPSLSALFTKKFDLSDLSHLDEAELIGRKTLIPNLEDLRNFVKGKRIIVTGAGGSIGSELCRQLHFLEPSYLGLLDRDETGILKTQLTLDNQGLLCSPNLLLADIRDRERLDEIFELHKPDLVFHAAALKHLSLLEINVDEAWKTNVLGTLNLLHVSKSRGVKKFINISTDKAASPISVLGKSKLITEQLTLFFANQSDPFDCISVRFGNVFGSNGSVIGTFNYQISKGGPVIVTDPEVSRYFMTIHEAVQLVLRSAILGRSGETLILEMGQPVKILELAKKIIARSGKEIEIEFSGLRQGEKLDEILFSEREEIQPTPDPLISKTRVADLDSIEAEDLFKLFRSQTSK
jgi:FlaA1/EpsC-like NDP-sugar epimerase